jgi:hypothetical protein
MSFDAMGRLNGCSNDSYRAFALPSPAAKQSFGPLNSAGGAATRRSPSQLSNDGHFRTQMVISTPMGR